MKGDEIRAFVVDAYLQTHKAVFVSDLMGKFNTSAAGIRSALGYDDFVFEKDDRWAGSNYAGRYVQSPCVEPTKTYLAKLLKEHHEMMSHQISHCEAEQESPSENQPIARPRG
jgi:hypothetical protein